MEWKLFWTVVLKKLFTFNYDYKATAAELINGYGKYMSEDDLKLISCLASGKRLEILRNKRIKSRYTGYDFKFRLQILIRGR